MPDSLILESPAQPSISTAKRRCAKAGKSKPAVQASAEPTSTIAALAAATAAGALPNLIFSEADWIEIGTRRAKTSLDVVWSVMDDVSDLGGKLKDAGDDHLEDLAARLYLLLGIVNDELKSVHGHADKIADAARELKQPVPCQSLGNDEGLAAILQEVRAAEDALNNGDEDAATEDAYDTATERFVESPVHTLAGVLLKLERLAEIGEMEKDPALATNAIVLSLLRDLRPCAGTNGQVQ